MSKFNPGDMALTIYPIPKVEAGTVVLLDKKIAAGGKFQMFGLEFFAMQDGWLCSIPGTSLGLAYAETSLMPLRGDFAPEQKKSREVPA
jgi:hypothetical protein